MKWALEIGPGSHPASSLDDGYSWMTIEHPGRISHGANGYFAEWGSEMLPISSDSVDLFYASHVLEHVPWNKTAAALSEAFRVLKPGGTIELWVPNFRYLVECYLKRQCGDDWRCDNPNNDPMFWLNGRLFTYGPEPNFHKACFDADSLKHQLEAAGFHRVKRIDGIETERGHKHGPISLGVRAFKP